MTHTYEMILDNYEIDCLQMQMIQTTNNPVIFSGKGKFYIKDLTT